MLQSKNLQSLNVTILLLYSLLHGNKQFCEYAFSRGDSDALLMPIIEALYDVTPNTANGVYIMLIVLLKVSQDSAFVEHAHKRILLPSLPFFKDRSITDISLGSTILVVILRLIQTNLFRPHPDTYLFTNCFAALANMAPHCENLHPYAAQRIVNLIDLISRRFRRLRSVIDESGDVFVLSMGESEPTPQQLQEHSPGTPKAGGDDEMESRKLDPRRETLDLYTEFIRILLEIVSVCLKPPSIVNNIGKGSCYHRVRGDLMGLI